MQTKEGRKFKKRLVYLDIRQILAGISHPQTNGKLERLHGEIQRKLHEFEEIMMRKSNHLLVHEMVQQATHVP